MIEQKTQYIVVCDSCGKRSGLHHDKEVLTDQVESQGWQSKRSCKDTKNLLFRCAACVARNLRPDGWLP